MVFEKELLKKKKIKRRATYQDKMYNVKRIIEIQGDGKNKYGIEKRKRERDSQ